MTRSFSTLAAEKTMILGCRDHVLEWVTNGEARRSVISLETFIHSTRCTRCIIKVRLCNSIHRVGCHVLLCFLLPFWRDFVWNERSSFRQTLHFLCKAASKKEAAILSSIETASIYRHALKRQFNVHWIV